MSDNTPTTPALLVYTGVRINGKGDGTLHWWVNVTPEELDEGTLPAEIGSRERSYAGKLSVKYMAAAVGTVYEVPEAPGSDQRTIYPGEARYKGLWPDQEQRTKWQVEHRTATTTISLRKQSKAEGSEDNFAALAPFRAKYKKLISQDQRAALLAQMIAYVTR